MPGRDPTKLPPPPWGRPAPTRTSRPLLEGPRLIGLLASPLLLIGCHTARGTPPFDSAAAGGAIHHLQAVWTPRRDAPGIAGDLLLARHANGSVLLEFSKASLPIALTRLAPGEWELRIPLRSRTLRGTGTPPPRSAWLVLARDLSGTPPPAGWRFATPAGGVMRLEHPSTGEILEIYSDVVLP